MRFLTITCITILLTACFQSSPVIIDKKGIDPIAYAQDLKECESYANEIEATHQVVTTAAEGAVVGGALGLILGDSARAAKRGAAGGGALGGYRGYKESTHDRERVIRNCLRGRGYRVL